MKRWFCILLVLLVCASLFAGSLYAAETVGTVTPIRQEVCWLLLGSIIASGAFVSIVRISWKHA